VKRKKKSALDVPIPEEHYPFPWHFRPSNYSDLYLMSCVPESQVQRDILQLLKTYRIDAIPVDAGGRRARGRVAAMASSLGLQAGILAAARTGGEIPGGFSDLEATLAPSGRALYIEVKAPAWCDQGRRFLRSAGAPSKEQLEFLLAKHKRGAVVLVAWSAQDVKEYLGPLLVENRKALIG
jgi:hypothetical protein